MKDKSLRSLFWFVVRIGIALAIIVWLVSGSWSDLVSTLSHIRLSWLLLAALCYLVHLLVGAWRWDILLKVQNIHISFFDVFSFMMQGFFFSLVIPGGALGGDIIKAGLIASKAPKGSKLEGTFTLLIDRFTGMVALFLLAGVAGLISRPVLMKLEGMMEMAVYALIIGCVAGLGAGFVIFFIHKLEKIGLVSRIIVKADTYLNGMVSRLTAAMDMYRNKFKTVLFCILLSIIFVHFNMAVVLYCLARSVGAEKISEKTVLLAVTVGNTAGLVPGPPSGVGTRDAVIKSILQAGGFSEGEAIAMPLLYTAIILTFSIIGGGFFIIGFYRKKPLIVIKTPSASSSASGKT